MILVKGANEPVNYLQKPPQTRAVRGNVGEMAAVALPSRSINYDLQKAAAKVISVIRSWKMAIISLIYSI
jgi:hypothetical protein